MLEVVSVGSGSCGNALLVRTTSTLFLVDCGVGIRRMAPALRTLGVDIGSIDALLLSHEHSDHVKELPRFVSLRTPTICTRGTALAAGLPLSHWEECAPQRTVRIGDAEIRALPISHDAAEPCAFFIQTPDGAVTVATDIGTYSGVVAEAIADSRLVMIEANHDEEMVRRSSYPRHLQRRILSETGHLSNRDCAALLAGALKAGASLPTIWLAHLSESNNRPALARKTVMTALAASGFRIEVAPLPRRDVGPHWTSASPSTGAAQLSLDFFV